MSSSERTHRRSAFNGARQLRAAQVPARRILILLAVLAVVLLVCLSVVVGVYLQGGPEQVADYPTAATQSASH